MNLEALETRTMLTASPLGLDEESAPTAADDFYTMLENQTLATAAKLIHHWKFDETSRDVAEDSAGDGDGLLVNWEEGEDKWVSGMVGGALSFSDIDQYVIAGDAETLDRYSFAFWLNRTGESLGDRDPRILSSYHEAWVAQNDQTGEGIGFFGDIQAPTPPVQGVWEHYVVTLDRGANTASIYQNGELVSEGEKSALPPMGQWIIGHHGDLENHLGTWNGLIDDLRIYDGVLTPEQAAVLYCGCDFQPNDVLQNDTDPENDSLTAELVDDVSHGVLEFNADGTFRYTPDTNYFGYDTFTYRATDGISTSNLATVTICIADVTPAATDDFYHVIKNQTLETELGLIHHWTFDDLSGDYAYDSAQGTFAKLVNWNAEEERWVPGKLGGALSFSDIDQYVIAGDAEVRDQYTFSFWSKRTGESLGDRDPRILSSCHEAWVVQNDQTGEGIGFFGDIQAPTPPVQGVWEHYVVTLDRVANTASIYQNGGLVSEGEKSALPPMGQWIIGHHGNVDDHSSTWNGLIDDLRIYDRALTAEEAAAVYASVWADAGVLANDIATTGHSLTAELVDNVSHGVLEFNADGSFRYTPDANYSGYDTFTYRVADGTDTTDLGTVTIWVENTVPTAVDDQYELGKNTSLTIGNNLIVNQLLLSTSDIVYDPHSGMLYAAVTDGEGVRANSLTIIDPLTGKLGASLSFSSEPLELEITDDGKYIYVLTNKEERIERVNLATWEIDQQIDMEHFLKVSTMLAIPGRSEAVLVTRRDPRFSPPPRSTRVYELGVPLPEQGGDGPDIVTIDETGLAYGYADVNSAFDSWRMAIDENGIHTLPNPDFELTGYGIGHIAAADGKLFTNVGHILDLATGQQIGSFQGGENFLLDPEAGKFYTLENTGGSQIFRTYDIHTLVEISELVFPGISDETSSLQLFGEDGIAFRTANRLHLIQVDEVAGVQQHGVLRNDVDPDGDVLTVNLVDNVQHGALLLHSDGTFSYWSIYGYSGTDSFTYTVSDGTSTSNVATVTLTILDGSPIGSAPVAVDDQYEVNKNSTLIVDNHLTANQLSLSTKDIVSYGGKLYAAMSNSAGERANSLTVIDPLTGELGASLFFTSEPIELQVTDDGKYIYAVTNDRGRIERVNLASWEIDQQINMEGFLKIRDLLAIPGRSEAVLVSRRDSRFSPSAHSTQIYEFGVPLPVQVGQGTVGDPDIVTVDETGLLAYGYTNSHSGFDSWRMAIDENGIHTLPNSGLELTGYNIGYIAAADGKLFTNTGRILDLATGQQIGSFQGGENFLIDPVAGRLYTLQNGGEFQVINVYDIHTLVQISQALIPGISDETSSLQRFGENGIAFRTADKVHLIRVDEVAGVELHGILLNDADPDGHIFAANLVDNVQRGNLVLYSDGTFSYTPITGYTGTDSFTYTVTDGIFTSNVATVTFTVRGLSEPPRLSISDAQAIEGQPLLFDLKLSWPNAENTVLRLATENLSATGGVDFETTNFQYSTDNGATWKAAGGPQKTDVTIPAYATSIKVRIDSFQDRIFENDETFKLLATVVSGTVAEVSNAGIGTIINDDPAPIVTIGNAQAAEGQPLVFDVKLSRPSMETIALRFETQSISATGGLDFETGNFQYSIDGGLTWKNAGGPQKTDVNLLPGITAFKVRIASFQDRIFENSETFRLLATPIGGTVGSTTDTGMGTILNDDLPPKVTIGNGQATEGQPVVFDVKLSHPSAGTITLRFGTQNISAIGGVDFKTGGFQYSIDGGLTWKSAGGPQKTDVKITAGLTAFKVRIGSIQDRIFENNETFRLLATPIGGTVGSTTDTGTGTILNDDLPPKVTIGNGQATEGQPVVFDVKLSHPSAGTITLRFGAQNISAIGGLDFKTGGFQYSIDGGSTWKSAGGPQKTDVKITAGLTAFKVRIGSVQDRIFENSETFRLLATPISGTVGSTTDTGMGTILNDDPAPTVTIGNAQADEGQPLVFDVSLSRPSAGTIGLRFEPHNVTAAGGQDYEVANFQYSIDGGLTWANASGPQKTDLKITSGLTAIKVRIDSFQDLLFENSETFTLLASVISGTVDSATDTGIGKIIDDDSAFVAFGSADVHAAAMLGWLDEGLS